MTDQQEEPGALVNPEPEAHRDLRTRWLPSEQQIQAATAALAVVDAGMRDRFVAVVPLAQPGKSYGIWEVGQQVVPLPGIWLGENVPSETLTAYPLRVAQQTAEQVAQAWLDDMGLTGTVAVAMIHPDGHAAVFESIMSVGVRP